MTVTSYRTGLRELALGVWHIIEHLHMVCNPPVASKMSAARFFMTLDNQEADLNCGTPLGIVRVPQAVAE